ENVLRNLSDKAFNKPICEALLNQKYFNGIGNYLRAEILYRLKIPPFQEARTVLEKLQHREETRFSPPSSEIHMLVSLLQTSGLTLSKKVKLKRENPDLLELCHMVPMEVINLELFQAGQYINAVCGGLVFSGKVEKSEVSKNPEVPFESDGYRISATSRGKELKLTLAPIKGEEDLSSSEKRISATREGNQKPMDLVFRFGMSGSFEMVPVTEMPKHAHLRFYTKEKPLRVLCYVDFRRFGRWEVDGSWQADRGPCVMQEYEKFR
ncbi:hypothetical protein JD844_014232, partial [Phrynosoma platyrhinos]